MNTFSDIFKKSFLEGFNGGNITTGRVAVTLMVTVLLAAYLFFVYYVHSKKSFYDKSFNVSLALISVITAAIVLAMQSNLVISLGMVGALSIVRFRTAIKEPMDLMFLFWSISIGIICGANLFTIAILASLVITIGLLVLELTPIGMAASLLVVSAKDAAAETAVLEAVRQDNKVCRVKSRNLTERGLNLIVECKPKDGSQLLQAVQKIDSVYGVSLMAHDGEVTV
ncbi:MAG: DUF4956 domain-containing protein [Lachnospiraceae bacterium]|nr:DUF4956 domain-containing protein [Lachnospiraceae bacterium]